MVRVRPFELLGVASLHDGDFACGADAFLAPTSILSGSLEERVAILARLLQGLFRSGLEAGIRDITIEYDSTYDDLAALAGSWPSAQRTVRDIWLRT
ncbi:MAG: hypothetical protein ACE367_10400 [Acidimicrobiales bacterium]